MEKCYFMIFIPELLEQTTSKTLGWVRMKNVLKSYNIKLIVGNVKWNLSLNFLGKLKKMQPGVKIVILNLFQF